MHLDGPVAFASRASTSLDSKPKNTQDISFRGGSRWRYIIDTTNVKAHDLLLHMQLWLHVERCQFRRTAHPLSAATPSSKASRSSSTSKTNSSTACMHHLKMQTKDCDILACPYTLYGCVSVDPDFLDINCAEKVINAMPCNIDKTAACSETGFPAENMYACMHGVKGNKARHVMTPQAWHSGRCRLSHLSFQLGNLGELFLPTSWMFMHARGIMNMACVNMVCLSDKTIKTKHHACSLNVNQAPG